MAKYCPLKDELIRDDRPTIVMSFNDIERLVGPLPATSHGNQWWWGNEDNKIRHSGSAERCLLAIICGDDLVSAMGRKPTLGRSPTDVMTAWPEGGSATGNPPNLNTPTGP